MNQSQLNHYMSSSYNWFSPSVDSEPLNLLESLTYLGVSILVLNVTPGDFGDDVFFVGLGIVAGGGALTVCEGWLFTEASTNNIMISNMINRNFV